MKTVEKKEARRLRSEEGMSVRKIARNIGVSKGTVSRWVRDINLTESQKEKLKAQNPIFNRVESQLKRCETFRKGRLDDQMKGREKARSNDLLFGQGCMLYWAEGWKHKNSNSVNFANSDSNMMRLFIRFLRKCFNIRDNDFILVINCYTNNGLTLEDITRFWLKELELPPDCLRKCQVNNLPTSSSGNKRGKLKYGVCYLKVYKTNIIQEIFGGIQELGGFDNIDWLG